MLQIRTPNRIVALALALALILPTVGLTAGCGSSPDNTANAGNRAYSSAPANYNGNNAGRMASGQRQGMSTKQKVVLLAGAALLYYLYKKHQAAQQQTAGSQNGVRQGQLYRSRNGGVYYRDPQGRPVWVTAPSQGVQVPASEVQQYAPDYQQYQGQAAPPVPMGQRAVSATEYDPSLSGGY
jgi:hypothetical protein